MKNSAVKIRGLLGIAQAFRGSAHLLYSGENDAVSFPNLALETMGSNAG